MNVRLAIQVFSNGVAKAISFCASYGLYLQSQDKLLEKMSNFILNVREHGKKSLLLFQKGI